MRILLRMSENILPVHSGYMVNILIFAVQNITLVNGNSMVTGHIKIHPFGVYFANQARVSSHVGLLAMVYTVATGTMMAQFSHIFLLKKSGFCFAPVVSPYPQFCFLHEGTHTCSAHSTNSPMTYTKQSRPYFT